MISVATPAIVMRELMREFISLSDDAMTATYTHDLDDVMNAAAANASKNPANLPAINTLAWNRSVLSKNTLLNQRYGAMHSPATPVGVQDVYQFNGMFEVNFRYYASNIHDIERFEVLFGTEQGIRKVAQLELGFGKLGTLPYILNWEDISELYIAPSPNYVKYIAGSFRVEGPFMVGNNIEKTNIVGETHGINVNATTPAIDDVKSNVIFYS